MIFTRSHRIATGIMLIVIAALLWYYAIAEARAHMLPYAPSTRAPRVTPFNSRNVFIP